MTSIELYRTLSVAAGQINNIAGRLYRGEVEKAVALAEAVPIVDALDAQLVVYQGQ